MPITFTADLETGIAEIDRQHRQLFDRINGMLEACTQGKGRTEIEGTVRFLEEYVYTHFKTEEDAMVRRKYAAYATHKEQHIVFTKNMVDIKKQLAEKGPTLDIILHTNHVIVDWLKNHIKTLDKAFGKFIKDQKDGDCL